MRSSGCVSVCVCVCSFKGGWCVQSFFSVFWGNVNRYTQAQHGLRHTKLSAQFRTATFKNSRNGCLLSGPPGDSACIFLYTGNISQCLKSAHRNSEISVSNSEQLTRQCVLLGQDIRFPCFITQGPQWSFSERGIEEEPVLLWSPTAGTVWTIPCTWCKVTHIKE
jgi:hypothetical protein